MPQARAVQAARDCLRQLQELLLLGAVAAVAVVILICQIKTGEPVAQEEAAQGVVVYFQTYLEFLARRTLVAAVAVAERTT
jgi:hypothetical protein